MRIHISEQCYEALAGSRFQMEFRGVIELKVQSYQGKFFEMESHNHSFFFFVILY